MVFEAVRAECRKVIEGFRSPRSTLLQDEDFRNSLIEKVNNLIYSNESAVYFKITPVWEKFQRDVPRLLDLKAKILENLDRIPSEIDGLEQDLIDLKLEIIWSKFQISKVPIRAFANELLVPLQKKLESRITDLKLLQIKMSLITQDESLFEEVFTLAKEVLSAESYVLKFFSLLSSFPMNSFFLEKIQKRVTILILEIAQSMAPSKREQFLEQVKASATGRFCKISRQAGVLLCVDCIEKVAGHLGRIQAKIFLVDSCLYCTLEDLALKLAVDVIRDVILLESEKYDELLLDLFPRLLGWGDLESKNASTAKALALEVALILSEPQDCVRSLLDVACRGGVSKDSQQICKRAAEASLDQAVKVFSDKKLQNELFRMVHTRLQGKFPHIVYELRVRHRMNEIRCTFPDKPKVALFPQIREVIGSIQSTIEDSVRKSLLMMELKKLVLSKGFFEDEFIEMTEEAIPETI